MTPAPRYEVDVDDSRTRVPVDLDRLREVAADVLRHEGVAAAEISVALIDGETMRALNRGHLGHDYDTDVLSFLLDVSGPEPAEAGAPRGTGKTLDGEVLIGTDVALRSAKEYGWAPEAEVTLYLVHGLLHLAGYDDLTDDEKSVMRERERVHLARWGLTPVYAEGGATGRPAAEP